MSQRKIIVAGLLLIGVALVIWLRPSSSVGRNEVHSPLVVAGQGEFLPPAGSYDGPGAAIGISVPGGNLTDAMRIANSLEMIEALKQQAEAKYGPGESVPADGPTTAGSVINVAGRDIKLPDNVEIEAFISNAICQVGLPCLQTPIYALRNNETGHTIGVSIPTGLVGDPNLPEDELNQLRSEFKWLIDRINEE